MFDLRRVVDIPVAILILLVAGPLLLCIALAIRLESPGNPFFGGRRAGRDGKIFRIWKFRSMYRNAASIGPKITANQDPRITRIGSVLRRTKLDELPQCINLLLGDMTLVGPRPEDPEIVALYTPAQREVLTVRPGITGPGQISHEEEESDSIPAGVDVDAWYVEHLLPKKIETDLEYIRTRSLATDARILLATAGHVVRAAFSRRDRSG